MFADEGCTQYADGTSDTIYVRVNQSVTANRVWNSGVTIHQLDFFLTSEVPTDYPYISVWADWATPYGAISVPCVPGVYIATCSPGMEYDEPPGVHVIFYEDGSSAPAPGT